MPTVDKIFVWAGGIGSLLAIPSLFGTDWYSVWAALDRMSGSTILFILSLAAIAIGLILKYRSSKITPRNVRHKIDAWLHTFGLFHREQDFAPWHFTYVVNFRGVAVYIGRPKRLSGRYLSIQARVNPPSDDQLAVLNGLNPQQRREFYTALTLEIAKARIQINGRDVDNISLDRLVPITNQLSESEVLESLSEIQMSVVVIQNTLTLWLSPNPNLAQLSPTEATETPPVLTPPPSPKSRKGKKE